MDYNVAVIILNYNSWEDTIKEINICNNILSVKNRDIIVVDNCSPNDSAEQLKKQSIERNFVFIESKENKGYGAGNNIGLECAYKNGYKYALILNNDIIVEDSNLLFQLLRVFEIEKKAAIVNPDIYSPDGHMFNRDSVRPSFIDYTFGAIKYKKKGRKIEDMGGYGNIYRPQGCCMLVDLEKMREVGFFDEETFLYFEESILAEKLLTRGYKCFCNTATSVIHNHSKTVKSTFDIKRIISINNKSFAYYLRKYRGYGNIKIKVCCFFNSLKLM